MVASSSDMLADVALFVHLVMTDVLLVLLHFGEAQVVACVAIALVYCFHAVAVSLVNYYYGLWSKLSGYLNVCLTEAHS